MSADERARRWRAATTLTQRTAWGMAVYGCVLYLAALALAAWSPGTNVDRTITCPPTETITACMEAHPHDR